MYENLEKFSNTTHESLGLNRRWDFSVVGENYNIDNICGSVGCKLGIIQLVFSDDFYTDTDAELKATFKNLYLDTKKIKRFLNLTDLEFRILFMPSSERSGVILSVDICGETISQLSGEATEDDVNNNIKRFLELKKRLWDYLPK